MCWYPLFRAGTRTLVVLSKICSVVPKPKQTFIGILLCFIVTVRVCVPGRDCSLGLQDSDRPYGLPGWLWQTGLDPPTPDVLPDCWDLTHQPGRLPVRTKYSHQQKQAVARNTCVVWALYLSCSFSQATQGSGSRCHTVSKCSHISGLTVHGHPCHGFSQDLDGEEWMPRMKSGSSRYLVSAVSLRAYLRVPHHTLNAVKVGEVTDGLVVVVQHSSNSLQRWQHKS